MNKTHSRLPHSQHQHQPRPFSELPTALSSRDWKSWLYWLLPLAAVVAAAWFIGTRILANGPTIVVQFDNAASLQPGRSVLKYRGAEIGTVEDVELAPDMRTVTVTISVARSASAIASEGARFWIVQPQVSVQGIRGLGTLVSGDYVAVEPGHGKRATRFRGQAEPPVVEPEGVLHIVLLAEKLDSLKQGSPIFYRGVQVGEVSETGLGEVSQTIEVKARIDEHYAPLVRMNSRFWNAGGIHVNIGLSGADISAESARTLVSGGIAFATPDTLEPQARHGTTFRLYDQPENEWLSWAPPIQLRGSVPEPSASSTEGGL